jgi:hypothetical protein
LRKALKKYFHFYNTERPHQTFDVATPGEIYQQSIELIKKEKTDEQNQLHTCALVNDSDYVGPAQAVSVAKLWTTKRRCPQLCHTLELIVHRVHRIYNNNIS